MTDKQFAVFSFIAFLIGIAITGPIGVLQVLSGKLFLGISSIGVAVFLAFLEVKLTKWYISH